MQEKLTTSGDYVILAYQNPIINARKFISFTESVTNEGTGTILKRDFRYSYDSETFSEYLELNNDNLNTLTVDSNQKIWFEFRYALMTGGPASVQNVSIQYDTYAVDQYEGYVAPNIQSPDYAYPITYKSGATWEPYKLNKAVRLYKDLNLMVNSLFGHEVQYYRALPQGRSKDVILMEYSLFEHDEMQCIKVIVPNNEFPDNKLNMGPMGVDFEMPFEIQIDKDYFQSIFGHDSGPQKRDVIFFPRTGRIYEISSSYLFRDFMNVPLYFKATLIKWNPKSDAKQSVDLSSLESMTVSVEKLFGKEIKNEEKDIANPVQFNPTTIISDPVREYLAPLAEILDAPVMNYFLTVAEHQYNLSKTLSDNIASVNIKNTDSLIIDKIYYARGTTSINTYPDISESLMSMKKLKYKGLTQDNEAIFEFNEGTSLYANNFPKYSIFRADSTLSLFNDEYSIGSTASPILKCSEYQSKSFQYEVVRYKAMNEFTTAQDRAISCWFKLKKNDKFTANIVSISYDEYSNELTVSYDRAHNFFIDDQISIQRKANSNFNLIGSIKTILNSSTLILDVNQEIINYANTVFSSWKTYTDLTLHLTYPNIFIDSLKNKKGIRVELWGKRFFVITSNSDKYFFILPNTQDNLQTGKWYSIFVSFSNLFSQLTLNIWEMQWNAATNTPSTSDLKITYSNTLRNFPKIDRTSNYFYNLKPSDMELTNVRVWNQKAETDKQPIILNQNIVKDAHIALVIDNAVPISRLPYISYTH